jgi:hypothetical protein
MNGLKSMEMIDEVPSVFQCFLATMKNAVLLP